MGAILAGIVGGFLGLGGGVILVPFLTTIFKMPIHHAVALSLAAIMANSIVSSNNYMKKGMVDFRLVTTLCIFASLGAIAGSNVSAYIPGEYLKVIFSFAMAYTAFSIIRKKQASREREPGDGEPSMTPVAIIALFAGVFSALLGVGGGIIIIPAVYLLLNYDIGVARGSSAFTVGITATAGSIVYLINGTLQLHMVGPVIIGLAAGGWLGSWLGARAKSIVVRYVFAAAMVYLAVRMFLEGLG